MFFPMPPPPKKKYEPPRGPRSLREFIEAHAGHGRAGAWRDAKIGVWNRWRCTCGEIYALDDVDLLKEGVT